MNEEIKNAIIENAVIIVDEHEFLTAWLTLDYGGSGQGFGGYILYLPESYRHHNDSMKVNFAGRFICRIMQIAGVENWDKLKGKTLRVKITDNFVEAIGHIVNDDWFNPKEDFARFKKIKDGVENE